VRVDEPEPGGDDAGRVRSHRGHVEERHGRGLLAERLGQRVDPVRQLSHQHRLAAGDALGDEGSYPLNEVVQAPVEDGRMVKTRTWRADGQR